jgi:hypothetical protein
VLSASTTANVCTYPSPALTCTEAHARTDRGATLVSLANSVLVPAESRLPESLTCSGIVIRRYEFTVANLGAHLQLAAIAQSDFVPGIQAALEQQIEYQRGYARVDWAAGLARGRWQAELFVQNAFDR